MSAIKRFPGGSSPASVSQHRHPRFDPNLTKLQTYDTDTSEILITVGYASHKIEWDIHIACGSCLQYLFLSNRFKSLLFALCVCVGLCCVVRNAVCRDCRPRFHLSVYYFSVVSVRYL